MDFTITDFDGRPLTVGTRVKVYDADLDVSFDVDALVGIVTDLGDFDGDVNDEGRPIPIYPRLTVRFDDGTTERFDTGEWRWSQCDEPSGKCEDVDALCAPPITPLS